MKNPGFVIQHFRVDPENSSHLADHTTRKQIQDSYLFFTTGRDQIVYYKKSHNVTDDAIAFVVPAFEGARKVVS